MLIAESAEAPAHPLLPRRTPQERKDAASRRLEALAASVAGGTNRRPPQGVDDLGAEGSSSSSSSSLLSLSGLLRAIGLQGLSVYATNAWEKNHTLTQGAVETGTTAVAVGVVALCAGVLLLAVRRGLL